MEGYVPMPKMLLRAASELFSPKTALTDLIVTLAIADSITVRRKPVSFRYLAFLCGLPEETVEESIGRLVEAEYLSFKAEENHRYRPEFTGLFEKVAEINRQWEAANLGSENIFPDPEENSSP